MNRKVFTTSMAAVFVLGAASAFAANPFVDVPADSWAYKSVTQLAQQGVIQGVDGSYFQGGRNITRYEAAEMVAKAMAHMDKADAEQRAQINKLASEFSDELNNLGVRVANLENKVGNVKTTGDFRLRYQHQKNGFSHGSTSDTGDQFDYRARIRFKAVINDTTKAELGISSNDLDFDSGEKAESNHIYFDLANVSADIGNHVNVKAGRWEYQIGGGMGLQHSDTFDGAQIQVTEHNWTLTGGYGEFKLGADLDNDLGNTQSLTGVKTGFAALDGQFGRLGAGLYYNSFSDSRAEENNLKSLWGGYAKVGFGKAWTLIGDYQKIQKSQSSDTDEDAALWGAQLTYGGADTEKQGSWDAWVEYINADPHAIYGSTSSWRTANLLDNVKSWGIGVDYTLAPNVLLTVSQTLGTSAKQGNQDPDELTRAEINFSF